MKPASGAITKEDWLAKHPYLEPIARLHSQVNDGLTELAIPLARVPNWNDYVHDFYAGVPLIRSSSSIVDLNPVNTIVRRLIQSLDSLFLPEELSEEIRGSRAQLDQIPRGSIDISAWLLDANASAIRERPLLRYIGWRALASYLSRVATAFESWRCEERWMRNYCPLCGSLPATAQVISSDTGKIRFLSCDYCGTRWQYPRIACPFCEDDSQLPLRILTIAGQAGLRIDYCESCRGYLKTYEGQGSEDVLLCDWASLHLDVVARARGLKRLAGSLYEL